MALSGNVHILIIIMMAVSMEVSHQLSVSISNIHLAVDCDLLCPLYFRICVFILPDLGHCSSTRAPLDCLDTKCKELTMRSVNHSNLYFTPQNIHNETAINVFISEIKTTGYCEPSIPNDCRYMNQSSYLINDGPF
ncbi:uncharacterized protein LOC132563203, partial [Ylistrum balloti]